MILTMLDTPEVWWPGNLESKGSTLGTEQVLTSASELVTGIKTRKR